MASRLQLPSPMNTVSKALAAIVLTLCLAAPAAAARPEVFFDGGRVSAVAFETPLRDVMRALAAETGFDVRFVSDAGDEVVDVEIFELPLSEAFARILAHRGHSVVGRQVRISSPVPGFVANERSISAGAHETYVAELGFAAIENGNARSRLAATAALVRERSALAVEALEGVLDIERSAQIRASALRALEKSGNVSLDSLVDLARDEDAGMLRRKAIQLLSRHGAGSELAESTLVELASDASNPMVRLTARTALRTLERAAA